MKKSLRKLMAALTALCMCMSLMSMTAFAEEVDVETSDGSKTTIDVQIDVAPGTPQTDDEGNTSTTTKTTTQDVDPDDSITYSEETENTVVTDKDGNKISETGKTEGESSVVEEEEGDPVEGDPVQNPAPSIPSVNPDAGDVSVTLTPGTTGNGSASVSNEELAATFPAENTTGTTQTGENGESIVTTIKHNTDSEGKLTGYTQTVTTTPKEGENLGEAESSTSNTEIKLPEKPVAGESTDADGNKTTVVVEEVKDGDTVIGYKTVTTVTDAEGNVVSSANNTQYGTKTTTTVKTVVVDNKIVTTTDVVVDELTDRSVTASMGNVTDNGEVSGVITQQMTNLGIKESDLVYYSDEAAAQIESIVAGNAVTLNGTEISNADAKAALVAANSGAGTEGLSDAAKALYAYLSAQKTEAPQNSGNSITSATITVKDETATEGTYNVDLQFTLEVYPSKNGDDLIVKITTEDGKTITKRLAGDDSITNFGKIEPTCDADGNILYYMIPGLELAEGVNVNLQLTGTQALAGGTFVYDYETETEVKGEAPDFENAEHRGKDYGKGDKSNDWKDPELQGIYGNDFVKEDAKNWKNGSWSPEEYPGVTISKTDVEGVLILTVENTIEMGHITTKGSANYVVYEIPGGVLQAGTYTLYCPDNNKGNNAGQGKYHGVSHVTFWGGGDVPEGEKQQNVGLADGKQSVALDVALQFNVTEASATLVGSSSSTTTTVTTTTTTTDKTWGSEWDNKWFPADEGTTPPPGENPPGENPPGGNPPGGNPPGGNPPGGNPPGGNPPGGNPPSGGGNPPSGGGNPPSGGGNPPTVIEIPDDPVPLAPPPADVADEVVEILDEEVPLANIPVTGDASLLWVVLSALSGTGLAGLSFAGKKREEEI